MIKMIFSEFFPLGFRVLFVDDDPVSLLVHEKMLRIKCNYKVSTCTNAKMALSLLREISQDFDVLLCDVHMPEMDGFELLNVVSMELAIPVVLISSDSDFDTVMKGVKQGACDFLIKPARLEELRNLWQHALRRKVKIVQHQGIDDDNTSKSKSANRKEISGNENTSEVKEARVLSRKERFKWTRELDEEFKKAIHQLGGIEGAKPRQIKELMNAPALTTGHIASHLQKYRKKQATNGHSDTYQKNQVYQNYEGAMAQPVNCWAWDNNSLRNQVMDSHMIAPNEIQHILLQNHNNDGGVSNYVNPSDLTQQPMSSLDEIGARNNHLNPGMISALVNLGSEQGFGREMSTVSEHGAVDHIGFVDQESCLPAWFPTDAIGHTLPRLSDYDEDSFAFANFNTEDSHYFCSF